MYSSARNRSVIKDSCWPPGGEGGLTGVRRGRYLGKGERGTARLSLAEKQL